jgi:hypothetical protein
LAASAGETAKEFTAKKKDESWREYEAKRVSGQLQVLLSLHSSLLLHSFL